MEVVITDLQREQCSYTLNAIEFLDDIERQQDHERRGKQREDNSNYPISS